MTNLYEKNAGWRTPTAIGLLLLMTLLVYGDVIFSPGVVYGQDIVEQGYTLAQFKYKTLESGELPIWNPYMMCGFSQMSAAPFYPFDYVGGLFSTAKAVTLRYAFHTFMAGVLMYFLLRRFRLSFAPSIMGAVVWMFSGFFIAKVYGGHGGAFSSGVWLPLSFLCLDRTIETGRLRDALLFGGVVGLQFLGEHAQYVFYSLLALGPYALYRLWPQCIRPFKPRVIARYAVLAVVAMAFAFTTSAVFLLPFREMTALSNRAGGTSYEYAASLSLPPLELITAIFPNIWGSPASHNAAFGALYWDGALYLGLVPFVLMLAAFRWSRDKRAVYFKWLALTTIILALGNYTPIYRLVYHIPGFSMVRAPSKMLFIYTLAGSILSAYGLGILLSQAGTLRTQSVWRMLSPEGKGIYRLFRTAAIVLGSGFVFFLIARPAILTVAKKMIHQTKGNPAAYLAKLDSLYLTQAFSIFIAAASAGIAFWLVWSMLGRRIPARAGGALLITISFIDLMIYADPLVQPIVLAKAYDFNKKEIEFLKRDQDVFRILPVEPTTFRYAQGVLTGLESVNGYYPILGKRYGKLSQAIDHKNGHLDVSVEMTNYNSKLMDLMNVKYILSKKKLKGSDLILVRPGPINIYVNSGYLPRVFLLRQVKSAINGDTALKLVTARSFDPKKTLILEERQPNLPIPPKGKRETAGIVKRSKTSLTIRVNAASPAYLFLSDQFDPRWKATLDGKPVKILRADYAFRAVRVPTGKHEITMTHNPPSRTLGATLTTLSYITILLVLVSMWIETRILRERQDLKAEHPRSQIAGVGG